jgi:uncharacterized protein
MTRQQPVKHCAEGPAECGCWAWHGWLLAPEGAAVHLAERTAVVADVHLGYEWARAARGDCLPAHSLGETIARLDRLLARVSFQRLVVAGDLVESPRPCRRTDVDRAQLHAWLEHRGVELIALRGNHDPPRRHLLETLEIGGCTVGHGHRPLQGDRVMFGHHHPVMRLAGVSARCFVVGERMAILPAFSDNAAGFDIRKNWPAELRPSDARCLVCAGSSLLDFSQILSRC